MLHIDMLRTSPYHPQTDGLVEHLKSMLRNVATEEGKYWDLLIPPLLFAYQEVPHELTGFSPFELLYGRDIRGPLKESWCGAKCSSQNVVSYVLLMRERLEKMQLEARDNMQAAQQHQKKWYDKGATERSFQPGDQVLVLLPTESSKLTAQWHGRCKVVNGVDDVNYLIKMHNRRKKQAVFHVQNWYTPTSTGFLVD
jgi:hypothetical protein